MSLALLIGIEILILMLQAFFSGSEMALISVDRLALRKHANKGNTGAKLALKLLSKPENLLTTSVIGTNICLTLQSTLVTLYIFRYYGHENEFYATLILTPIVLVFGEIIPKTIFQRHSEFIAPKVAPLILFARWLFAPMIWVLERYTNQLSKVIHPIQELMLGGKSKSSYREDLKYVLSYGRRDTTLKPSERRMIRRIFEFSKMDARKALIPLVHLDMIEDNLLQHEALDHFLRFGHSRLPVYKERVDNIVGILYAFDVISELNPSRPVTEIMRKPHYAPVSQQLEDLLFTMRKRGIPMAVVVNEYGGAIGALTLEDIVEEIVGDIKDEFDYDSTMFKQVSENEYIVSATIEIQSMNEALKISIPKGNYETLAGFLLQQFNRIPDEGDELYYANLKFVIRKANERSIEIVEITNLGPT